MTAKIAYDPKREKGWPLPWMAVQAKKLPAGLTISAIGKTRGMHVITGPKKSPSVLMKYPLSIIC